MYYVTFYVVRDAGKLFGLFKTEAQALEWIRRQQRSTRITFDAQIEPIFSSVLEEYEHARG